MPQQFPNPLSTRVGPLDMQFDLGTSVGASFDDALHFNPTASLFRIGELNVARGVQDRSSKINRRLDPESFLDYGGEDPDLVERISVEEQAEVIAEAGLTGLLEPQFGETRESLDLLIDWKRQETARQNVLDNARKGGLTFTAQLGAGLLGSMLDPLNVGSAFVPIFGHARFASQLGQTASVFGRGAIRAKRGFIEGAAGAAMVEPVVLLAAQEQQADYDHVDSMANLAFGSVLGGGLHGLGGFFKDRLRPPKNIQDASDAHNGLSDENRHQNMSTAAGMIANGQMVYGLDVQMRMQMQNATDTGVGYIRNGGQGNLEPIIQGLPQGGERVAGERFFVRTGDTYKTSGQARKARSDLQRAGHEAQQRSVEGGGYEMDLAVTANVFMHRPDGSYLSFPTRKSAINLREQLKKDKVITDGLVIRIGDEFFILDKEMAGPVVTKAIKENSKTIELPPAMPDIQTVTLPPNSSFNPSSISKQVPDPVTAQRVVQEAHSPENLIFYNQEQKILERVRSQREAFVDDLETIDLIISETDKIQKETEALRTEIDDETLSELDAVDDIAQADKNIEDTKQIGEAYVRAAACVMGAIG